MNVEDLTYCRFKPKKLCDEWIHCSEKCHHHPRSLVRIERLAAQQHAIWSHRMMYLLTKIKKIPYSDSDGYQGYRILTSDMHRWHIQLNTSYANLSNTEQESDREIVRKFILP